ncbi:MAG: hypothetical protein Kow0068_22970 [Marinilabiliales bacterium]
MSKVVKKINFEIDDNFFLIGIVCPDTPAKLAWKINNYLNSGFVITEPLKIISKSHPDYLFFTVYEYIDNLLLIEYHLIENKTSNGFLIETQRNIDYFMKISGEYNSNTGQNIINELKKIENIVTAFEINLDKLKEKHKQLFNF